MGIQGRLMSRMLLSQAPAAKPAAQKAAPASSGLSLTPTNPDGTSVSGQTPASPTLTPVTPTATATAAAPKPAVPRGANSTAATGAAV